MPHKRFLNITGDSSVVAILLRSAILTGLLAWAVLAMTAYFWPETSYTSWERFFLQALLIGLLSAPLIYFTLLLPTHRVRLKKGGEEQPPVWEDGQLSTVDTVTRTLNLRGIASSLLEAMAQAQRYNTPLAITLVRIERLQKIFDTHGTAGRDQVLKTAAAVIGEVLRMPDRVGRNAQDEFLIVMPQTKAPAATKVAERIRSAIAAAPVKIDGHSVKVEVGYGIAAFGKGQDLEKFISNAQQALTQYKPARPRAR